MYAFPKVGGSVVQLVDYNITSLRYNPDYILYYTHWTRLVHHSACLPNNWPPYLLIQSTFMHFYTTITFWWLAVSILNICWFSNGDLSAEIFWLFILVRKVFAVFSLIALPLKRQFSDNFVFFCDQASHNGLAAFLLSAHHQLSYRLEFGHNDDYNISLITRTCLT